MAAVDPSALANYIESPPLHRLLGELPQTMIVSTHDIPMVRDLLSRTVVMDEGRVDADGGTHVILSDTALLEAHGLEVF